MRHSKQTATLLLTFDILCKEMSDLGPKQWACMRVTFWGGKDHKCSSGHALNDKFPNSKQLMQAGKYGG